jgi:hypothetical protein
MYALVVVPILEVKPTRGRFQVEGNHGERVAILSTTDF